MCTCSNSVMSTDIPRICSIASTELKDTEHVCSCKKYFSRKYPRFRHRMTSSLGMAFSGVFEDPEEHLCT